jgi:hypothetical protein
MTTKKKKKKKAPGAAGDWYPEPKDIVEVIKVSSPETGDFEIDRTNEVDEYEEPLPPAPKKPAN